MKLIQEIGRLSKMKKVLFIQCTEAATLPPIMNAAYLFAEKGYESTILTAPISGMAMDFPEHPFIKIRKLAERPSHIVTKRMYLTYLAEAVRLAYLIRPNIVYASDLLGTLPGLFAANISRAKLVYHEHDSPVAKISQGILLKARTRCLHTSNLVVFPNEQRARITQAETGFDQKKLAVVWNVPRRAEVQPINANDKQIVNAYFHGSITPERLPLSVIDAIKRFQGRVRLVVAGYEAPGAKGYVAEIERQASITAGNCIAKFEGIIARRSDLLLRAASADIGFALMPMESTDINMKHMDGASNKVFDYMAAGVVPIVSDLSAWRELFVAPGYAAACDPRNVDSVYHTLSCLIADRRRLRSISELNREKIINDWNYDKEFGKVLKRLE